MKTADMILNGLIFLVTVALLIGFFRKDGHWVPERVKVTFRYFTVQSNVLCAVSALGMCIAQLSGNVPAWVWIFKYIGTAAVTLTMLTVFLFLAPSIGKGWYDVLLKQIYDLFMHLITPLAALVTFCVLEKRGMTFPQCLWGMLPVALYGPLYLYKIRFAPEEKRWDDFYGFGKGGKLPLMLAVMVAGMFLICLGIMGLQNL